MDRNILTKKFSEFTDEELQNALCEVEVARINMVDAMGPNHPKVNELHVTLDVIAGIMIKRADAKKNGPETLPTTPKAPNTFYQLMALGDGSLA